MHGCQGFHKLTRWGLSDSGSRGMLLGALSALYRRIRFLLVQTRIRCKWCFIFKCVVKSECFWREQNVTNLATNSDGRMRMCSDLGPQSPMLSSHRNGVTGLNDLQLYSCKGLRFLVHSILICCEAKMMMSHFNYMMKFYTLILLVQWKVWNL